MALAAKMDKKDYRVYCILGDGELQEGQCWEAFMSAPKFSLDNLTVIIDHNNGQIDGPVDKVMDVEPLKDKLLAFRWDTRCIDGHDLGQIEQAFKDVRAVKGKPQVIIAKTVKGKGVSFMEHNIGWHGMAPKKDESEKACAEILHG